MKNPKIVWVTHSSVSESEIREAIKCDIDGIQLRCKELSNEALHNLARAARAITHQAGKQLSINSAIAAAEELGADGIHLPESMINCCHHIDSLPVNISVHSLESAVIAQASGASALTFGPIFLTPSKQIYGEPQGLQKLEKIVKTIAIPVYAIGGITPARLDACLQAGACGVMMQSYISSIVKRRCSCL